MRCCTARNFTHRTIRKLNLDLLTHSVYLPAYFPCRHRTNLPHPFVAAALPSLAICGDSLPSHTEPQSHAMQRAKAQTKDKLARSNSNASVSAIQAFLHRSLPYLRAGFSHLRSEQRALGRHLESSRY